MQRTSILVAAWLLAPLLGPAFASAQGFPPDLQPFELPALTSPAAVALGDFDGDGADDLVVSVSDELRLWSNDGSGNLAPSASAGAPGLHVEALALGDVDGDGRLDCVGIDRPAGQFAIALGDGAGGFALFALQPVGVPLAAAEIGIALGDLDGDGLDDVVINGAHSSQSGVLVFRSHPGAVLGSAVLYGPAGVPANVALGDVDGDGLLDVVMPGTWGVSVLRGDGAGGFAAPVHYGGSGGTSAVALADVDGDGLEDVCATRAGDFSAVVLRSIGAGSLSRQATLPLGTLGRAPVFGDFSRDGRLDLAIGRYGTGGVATFMGGGAAFQFTATAVADPFAPVLQVADGELHGDAAPDLAVVANSFGVPLTLLLNQTQASNAGFAFCAGKPNSLGCLPALEASGVSSAGAASGFTLACTRLLSQRTGLLFYSAAGPAQRPFLGGTLCLEAPLRRTPAQNSGGSISPVDCSGSIALDFNAFASGALGGTPAPELSVIATEIAVQTWSRDSGSSSNASLSDGFVYSVGP